VLSTSVGVLGSCYLGRHDSRVAGPGRIAVIGVGEEPVRAEATAARDLPSFPSRGTYGRERVAGDLFGRSLVGPVFYALGCVVTASVGGYFQPLRVVAWLPTLLFVALFFLRRTNRPPQDLADAAKYGRWRGIHLALIHFGCLLWGVVFTYVAWVERDYRPPLVIAVICAVMFGAALSQAFAMEKRHTTVTLALLYGPAFTFFACTPALRALAITLGLYSLYLLSSLWRLAREYDTQIETEYALILSRAEVEKLTRVDPLTGLANRREYEHVYPQTWQQGLRQKGELAVLVFDLDHFKGLNDRYGHLAGDACLQHFASLLKGHFRRDADLLARLGGEEFVVVVPGAAVGEAARMADQFRGSLERSPCTWKGKELTFTVSVGVGAADWSWDTKPEATFARIDHACYEAKTAGRNRVVVATSPSGRSSPGIDDEQSLSR